MRFVETELDGVLVIEAEPHRDERGWFARAFDRDAFAARGLPTAPVQTNLSHNAARHTLRGMHYQAEPHGEPRLVSCLRGAIFDVVIDLRPGSPTRGRWTAAELSSENLRQLYVPIGFAHGFLTLTDDALVGYQMFAPYQAAAGRGVRWDDPGFAITWPHPPAVISARDAAYPDWTG